MLFRRVMTPSLKARKAKRLAHVGSIFNECVIVSVMAEHYLQSLF